MESAKKAMLLELNLMLNGRTDEPQLYINGYVDGLLKALTYMGAELEYDKETNSYREVEA